MDNSDYDVKARFKDLATSSHFHVLVPQNSEKELTTILTGDSPDAISRIAARRNVYFDEKAGLLLVLSTKFEKDPLCKLLDHLEITLSAHATDTVPQGSGNAASGKHDLSSHDVAGSEAVELITTGGRNIVLWKPTVYLTRPKVRLQRPTVYFTAYLNLSPQALDASRRRAASLLGSFESLPANLLDPLQYDAAYGATGPYISETRIAIATAPHIRPRDDIKPVRAVSKRALPITPAFFSRVKYSALPNAVIASVQVEASRLMAGILTVQELSVNVANARAKPLDNFPERTSLEAGDEISFLFQIDQGNGTVTEPASISVSISATVEQDEPAQIVLQTQWQTQIDISRMISRLVCKWSQQLRSRSQQADQLSLEEAHKPTAPRINVKENDGEEGMVFWFSTPPTVTVRKQFSMRVQCINRTTRTRRFTVIHLRPTDDSPISNSTTTMDVHCIKPDVQVGPLAPQAMFEADMKFTPQTLGPLNLGCVRILDLDSQRNLDVKKLPDVVATEDTEDETEDQTLVLPFEDDEQSQPPDEDEENEDSGLAFHAPRLISIVRHKATDAR